MAQNKSVRTKSMLAGMLTGTIAGMAMLLIGSLVITSLVYWGTMRYETVGYAVMLIMLIGTFLGCFTAAMTIKNQTMLVSLAVGGMLLLLMLAVTVMFFEGQFNGVPVMFVLIIGSSLAAALVCARIQNRPKSYHKKR